MTKGGKIAIAIGGLAVLGVGGYFLYKRFGKKKPTTPYFQDADMGGGMGGNTGGGNTSSGNTGGGNTKPTNNEQNKINIDNLGSIKYMQDLTSPTKPVGNDNSNVGCGGGYSGIGFPLKKGSCGYRVKRLQKYLGITADGKYGKNTASAVMSKQNMIVTNPIGYSAGYGKVGEADYRALPI